MTDLILQNVNQVKNELEQEQEASTSGAQEGDSSGVEEGEYEVEKILKTKIVKGKRFFFVSTRGGLRALSFLLTF